MGNNVSYKVFGVRGVQMKMFDCIVRTLIDMWRVLDLKKNFISLGTLDKNAIGLAENVVR